MEEIFYHELLMYEFGFAALVLVILFFVSAPYGKFIRKGWGLTIPAKFAWFIMEMPAVLVILVFFMLAKGWQNPVQLVFIILWQSHYLFRTLVYPFIMGGKNKPYPVLLVLFAILFNILNGAVNGYFIFVQKSYDLSWFMSLPFILGFGLYIFGFLVNKQSDFILRALRKESEEYQIPTGGFFKWISNPHYFGEFIQWSGWAVMTWSLAGLAFAAFTFGNLFPRAVSNHKWYKEHFPDYPEDRKAMFPFMI